MKTPKPYGALWLLEDEGRVQVYERPLDAYLDAARKAAAPL